MDLRNDHQLTERTRENDGDVYVLGNIVQVFYDGEEIPETYTCLRVEDAQQKFDALTQGWYRNPANESMDQFQQEDLPVLGKPIKLRPGWKAILYEDGQMLHWKAKKVHHEDADAMFNVAARKEAEFFCDTDIIYLRSFVDKGLCYAQNWFQYFNKLRLTDEVSIDDWGSSDSEKVDEFHGTVREFNEYCTKLREREENPPSPLERKSPRELKFGFNAFITPQGEWIQVPADGTTHYEFAVSNLGFQDLNDALYNGYIRVSFSPRGSTFIQVENMEESLPVIVEAVQELYKKYGSVQIVAEDVDNTYIIPLGTLAMANTVADLKENAKDWDTYLRE